MKFFKKVKEIRSKTGELHFSRFAIFECSFFAIYIHRIFKADKDPFCHTHPWNFFSVILWGKYYEQFHFSENRWSSRHEVKIKPKSFLSLGWGDRNYLHKIKEIVRPTTTLFFTFGKKKPWGFLINGKIIDSEEYIQNKQKYNP